MLRGLLLTGLLVACAVANELDPMDMKASFKEWQAQAESDRTDHELSILNEVSSNMQQGLEHRRARLENARRVVNRLSGDVGRKAQEVKENLRDAKSEAAAAESATQSANNAVTAERFKRVPLTSAQKRDLERGTEMYTDAQETAGHNQERAARIAQLQADVSSELHQLKAQPQHEHLLDPFQSVHKRRQDTRALRAQFKQVAAHEQQHYHEQLNRLEHQLASLQPKIVSLNQDEHESRMLDLQYDVVSKKLDQLEIVNQHDNHRTVEQQQDQLHSIAQQGSSNIDTELQLLKGKLEHVAHKVDVEDHSPERAQELQTANSIIAAATPNELD